MGCESPLLGSSMQHTEVDAAVEAVGCGLWQGGALLATGLTWTGDAMELSVMAYVLPVLQQEWHLPEGAADSTASIVFAGMLLGSLGWGLAADRYGRKYTWIASTALTALAGVASAAVPEGSVALFLFARASVGLGLSGTNTGFALSTELLPRRMRGKALVLFELFFCAGAALTVILSSRLLPSGEWRPVLFGSAAPLLCALILAPLVPESPRHLVVNGRAHHAILALQRAARLNRCEGGRLLSNAIVSRVAAGHAAAVADACTCSEPSATPSLEPACMMGGGSHDRTAPTAITGVGGDMSAKTPVSTAQRAVGEFSATAVEPPSTRELSLLPTLPATSLPAAHLSQSGDSRGEGAEGGAEGGAEALRRLLEVSEMASANPVTL